VAVNVPGSPPSVGTSELTGDAHRIASGYAGDMPSVESNTERTVFGVMTGTSLDALDIAAVRVRGAGLSVRCELIGFASRPLGDLKGPLRALASGLAMPAHEIAAIALRLGDLHAQAALELKDRIGGCDLCCPHGQTVVHDPPLSWQLLNPWPIATALRCPVVTDLRSADLATGGQGAPITPLADWVLFRSVDEHRVIVNLGGFCNITSLPPGGGLDAVRGWDVCACNQVIDAAARAVLDAPYDGGGTAALNGSVHQAALAELMDALVGQAEDKRSLGTGDEASHWVERWAPRLVGDDLCATVVKGVGLTIAASIQRSHGCARVFLAGGGIHNAALVRALRSKLGNEVRSTANLGVESDAREAACFAVLGALCADGVEIAMPAVTGGTGGFLSGSWINRR